MTVKELPLYVTRSIEKLSRLSQEANELNTSLLKWFRKEGYLNEDLDGLINDMLIDMTVTYDHEYTIKVILDIMKGEYNEDQY